MHSNSATHVPAEFQQYPNDGLYVRDIVYNLSLRESAMHFALVLRRFSLRGDNGVDAKGAGGFSYPDGHCQTAVGSPVPLPHY